MRVECEIEIYRNRENKSRVIASYRERREKERDKRERRERARVCIMERDRLSL